MRSTCALLLALPLLFLPGDSFAQEVPDLSGTWVLDEANSETPREKARERALERSDNPRARQRWERAETRERESMESAPFARLTLTQDEEVVNVQYRDGRSRSIHTDGRELEPDQTRGIVGGRARWEGPRLVVENDTPRGQRIEQWELSDDGKRLFVISEIQAGEPFGNISYRRIYDREPSRHPAVDTSGQDGPEDEGEGDDGGNDDDDDDG